MRTETPRSGQQAVNEPAPPLSAAGGGLELQLAPGMLVVMPWIGKTVVHVYRLTGSFDSELVAVVGDVMTALRLIPFGWIPRSVGTDTYWKKPS